MYRGAPKPWFSGRDLQHAPPGDSSDTHVLHDRPARVSRQERCWTNGAGTDRETTVVLQRGIDDWISLGVVAEYADCEDRV